MLEVIRLSSIARRSYGSKSEATPLLCVDRVRDLTLVDKIPQNRRLRIGLDIDVRGLGPWSGEVPTLVLDEEALRKTRTRVASANQLFQPTVDRGVVELQPVASVPSELLQVLQKTKR